METLTLSNPPISAASSFPPPFSDTVKLNPLQFREEPARSWFGEGIAWIKDAPSRGLLCMVITYAITFFAALALSITIIGLPIVLLGVKELTRQNAAAQRQNDRDDLEAQYTKNWNDYKTAFGGRERDLQTDLLTEQAAKADYKEQFERLKANPPKNEVLLGHDTEEVRALETKLQEATKLNAQLTTELTAAKEAAAVPPLDAERDMFIMQLQAQDKAINAWKAQAIKSEKELEHAAERELQLRQQLLEKEKSVPAPSSASTPTVESKEEEDVPPSTSTDTTPVAAISSQPEAEINVLSNSSTGIPTQPTASTVSTVNQTAQPPAAAPVTSSKPAAVNTSGNLSSPPSKQTNKIPRWVPKRVNNALTALQEGEGAEGAWKALVGNKNSRPITAESPKTSSQRNSLEKPQQESGSSVVIDLAAPNAALPTPHATEELRSSSGGSSAEEDVSELHHSALSADTSPLVASQPALEEPSSQAAAPTVNTEQHSA